MLEKNKMKKNKNREILDLTYNIEENMTTCYMPWHSKVKIEQLGRHNIEGRETRRVILGTHTGTHIDAPLHFLKKGKSIDQIPLNLLVGDVSIIDLSFLNENQAVTKEILLKIKITPKMIFKFNWSRNWESDKFYKGYPFFSFEAASYLIQKGVKLVAMDTPSPDDSRIRLGSEEDSKIHKLFLKNNVILIEYLNNLEKLKNCKGWKIIAMPLKIKGADGSPARVCIYK